MMKNQAKTLIKKIIGTITRVETETSAVALTFDDGPHPQFTPKLLDILERHRIRATFFMLGKYAQRFPQLVERVAFEGHAIGNHSWDHPSFPLISRKERLAQIRSCANALAPHGSRIFRPPFGHQTLNTRMDAFLLGYQVVTWDIVAGDWLDHDARWIADQVEQQMKPGSIILFHDALASVLDERYESREQTLKAVDMLLDNIGERYRFVTVPELFRHGKPHRVNWQMIGQSDFLDLLREPDGEPWQHS